MTVRATIMNIFLIIAVVIFGIFTIRLIEKRRISDSPDIAEKKCPDKTLTYTYGNQEMLCYYITNVSGTVDEMSDECAALHTGGQLAIIPDEGALFIIEETFLSFFDTFYIGVGDSVAEGRYINSDGEDQLYTNWAPNEPNDHNSSEDCVEMATGSLGLEWFDKSCTDNYFGFCSV